MITSSSRKGEEFATWLEGRSDVAHSSIVDVLLDISEDVSNELVASLPEPIKDPFTFICKEGEVVYECKESLRRLFHLVDDFLSDFPDEKSVTIPFTTTEVREVLKGDLLSLCYECLCHFNPKDPITYFDYSTIGMDPSILMLLHSRLTDKNKIDIMESRRNNTYPHPLPDEGFGRGTLAHILDCNGDDKSLIALFSDYPSYLTFALSGEEERNELLLTANYHRGEYWQPSDIGRALEIARSFIDYLPTLDVEERIQFIRRALAMMDVRDPLFENMDIVNCMPYNISLRGSNQSTQWRTLAISICGRISQELGLDEEKVKEVLERIVK